MGEDNIQKKKELMAQKILRNADLYKVCECCESVVLYDSIFCPLCSGYRFDEGLSKLVQTVKALIKKKNTTIIDSDYSDLF